MRLFILCLSISCVVLYGYALAGYSAYFFGRGRPDYIIWGLTLGTVCGAAALFMWKKWLRDTVSDLLVFDVDGVLIDTRGSYMLATGEAVRWCWKNMLEGDADFDGSIEEYFNRSKLHPAFNDDSAVAWVMLRAMRRTGQKSMKAALPSLGAWKKELDSFAPDAVIEELARGDTQAPAFAEVRNILEEIYFGAEAYAKYKGRAGYGAGGEGFWKAETPGIPVDWKELRLPAGVYTGRSRDEMALARKLLNWDDFPDDMLICSDDGILKPSPEGLSVLCGKTGTKNPIFFGDTESDRAAWKAFGGGSFVAIGPILKDKSRRGEFIHFDTLQEALSSLKLEA